MGRGRRFYHWFLVIWFASMTQRCMRGGSVVSGIIFLILTILVLPMDGITNFWNLITGNRRWLKYVLAIALFFAGLVGYPGVQQIRLG